jgi:hypothetical protein
MSQAQRERICRLRRLTGMATRHRSPHRRSGVILLLAIGGALGFSGHHALRALDLADAGASEPAVPVAAEAPQQVPVATVPDLPAPPPPTTAPPTTVAPTTTAPAAPSTTAPGPPAHRIGDRGPEVAVMQQRLRELGFWLPGADGSFGELTEQAVLAFQKHAGLSRDGVAGPATLAALEAATPVTAREGGDHAEIDLERQLLIVVRGGQTLAFNTSTGAAGTPTPPGRYRVDREIDGVRRAPLGDLYRPKYFHQGIAVHGSPSIPAHAASHGCARVHDTVMDLLWSDGLLPVGTPIWVR